MTDPDDLLSDAVFRDTSNDGKTEDDLIREALAAPCNMRQQEPFDFAWCDTHDETFPLGAVCSVYRRRLERRLLAAQEEEDRQTQSETLFVLDLDDKARGRS